MNQMPEDKPTGNTSQHDNVTIRGDTRRTVEPQPGKDPGRVPLEENQKHPTDPLKPGDEDEYGTRLEKLISKIEPPGHEVKDEDIMDPGHMTPGSPPVDNRS